MHFEIMSPLQSHTALNYRKLQPQKYVPRGLLNLTDMNNKQFK